MSTQDATLGMESPFSINHRKRIMNHNAPILLF